MSQVTPQPVSLTVPPACSRGHELTARTTIVRPTGGSSGRWECARCLRVELYRLHWQRRGAPPVEIPAEVLDERSFARTTSFAHRLQDVVFRSGWGYNDPDPTPELRAERDRERYGACGRGHAYTPDNAYAWSSGRRYCRVCRALNARRLRAGLPKLPDPRAGKPRAARAA